ncbi:hypothetical protein [Parvularcula sp. IMCC14364]|uniref:hypothetical protein n=1 Tax=Parvularcula sp. IMCC14364 TaxID=3067902 RepID=UPI002740E7DA|nr:hypothetical protein [Parvularcula sp. IMCC14364]
MGLFSLSLILLLIGFSLGTIYYIWLLVSIWIDSSLPSKWKSKKGMSEWWQDIADENKYSINWGVYNRSKYNLLYFEVPFYLFFTIVFLSMLALLARWMMMNEIPPIIAIVMMVTVAPMFVHESFVRIGRKSFAAKQAWSYLRPFQDVRAPVLLLRDFRHDYPNVSKNLWLLEALQRNREAEEELGIGMKSTPIESWFVDS